MTGRSTATGGIAARDRILEAAARLFADRGYERTKLAEVAAEAGVSKALVLWHFGSKERLLREALVRTLEPYRVTVDSLRGLDEAAQVDRLVEAFFEFVDENAASIRFLLGLVLKGDQAARDSVRRVAGAYRLFGDVIAGALVRGKASGTLPPTVMPETDARIVLAVLTGTLVERFLFREGDTPSSREASRIKHLIRERILGTGRRRASRPRKSA